MKLLHFKLPMMALALLMLPSMAFASGNLDSSDFTGMSFWLISMALVASTVFFLIERDRVAAKWKTSLTVSGLVTLIAAVHYFYMRDVWVSTGTSPTEFRYIDWLLTVPLLMVEFFLILSAIAKVPSGVFWRLLIFTTLMLVFGYLGESGKMNVMAGFVLGMIAWFVVLYEIFAGEASKISAEQASETVQKSIQPNALDCDNRLGDLPTRLCTWLFHGWCRRRQLELDLQLG
jgi:bacteriorhodopsin